jgi:hypothetical protein
MTCREVIAHIVDLRVDEYKIEFGRTLLWICAGGRAVGNANQKCISRNGA